jgi:peptidoglycan hydrolase-like protein with peptidoglycan-binding domain
MRATTIAIASFALAVSLAGSALAASTRTVASPGSGSTSSFTGSGTTGGSGEGDDGFGSSSSGAPTMTLTAVRRLQTALARLGYFHHVVTGYYGPVTTASVKTFQHSAGLQPDGIWGPLSQAALTRRLPGG